MNTSGIRRNFKNIVHNYSEAQVKVREATSNDPWGPSSTLMSEIADYSYNVVAFSEIMQLVWKRLNDHGKNWRHVYKALVLLEYLIKTGSEKVAQQCKENIFAIQTLKDFQFFEENKDHGMNVREKAKQLVALLKDDERLKNERTRALKARERFAQAAALGATEIPTMGRAVSGGGGGGSGGSSLGDGYQYQEAFGDSLSSIPTRTGTYPPVLGTGNGMSMYAGMTAASGEPPRAYAMNVGDVAQNAQNVELECARPQTAGEEELQLQLALAMSKEEAEQEEQKRRSDDVRLQMAITQSEEDFGTVQSPGFLSNGASSRPAGMNNGAQKQSNLLDLMDMPLPGPSTPSMPVDPWGLPVQQQQRPPPPRIPQFQNNESGSLNDLLGLDTSAPPSNVPYPPLPSTTYPYPPLGIPEIKQPTDPWSPVNTTSRSNTTSPMNTDPFLGRPSSSLGVPASDAFSRQPQPDPWSLTQPAPDPWGGATGNNTSFGSSPSLATNGDAYAFDQLGTSNSSSKSTNNLDAIGGAFCGLPADPYGVNMAAQSKKTPENFLGENSNLVNLDSLISSKPPSQMPGSTNPFAVQPPPTVVNAFQTQAPPRVSLNQMRTQQQFGEMSTLGYAGAASDPFAPQLLPTPLVPANQMATTAGGGGTSMANNPFL